MHCTAVQAGDNDPSNMFIQGAFPLWHIWGALHLGGLEACGIHVFVEEPQKKFGIDEAKDGGPQVAGPTEEMEGASTPSIRVQRLACRESDRKTKRHIEH